MKSSFFIVSPFSFFWFVILFAGIVFCYFFIKANKDKPEQKKRRSVAMLYACTTLFWITCYTVAYTVPVFVKPLMELNPDFFNIFNILPLHLCSVNMYLIIFGVLFKSSTILSFNFYCSTLGAMLAYCMPSAIENYQMSILAPTVLGFYIPHILIALQMPILFSLKLYRPKYKDIVKAIAMLLGLVAFFTIVNSVFRSTGIFVDMNYFFTNDPGGNPVFGLMYSLIGIPGVYLLPCLIIVLPYMFLATFVFQQIEKKTRCLN